MILPELFRTHQIYDHRIGGTYGTYNATLIVTDAVTGVISGATGVIVAIDTGAPKTYTIGTISGTFIEGEAIRKTSTLGTPGANEIIAAHILDNGGVLPVAAIPMTLFPVRNTPVTFATRIRITANGGVHRGLVFELGAAAAGCALWVGDQTIGFHAGAASTVNGATALYDRGVELPVGLTLNLVASVRPGNGLVRLWGNGKELARSQASGLAFSPVDWAGAGSGSFASAHNGTAVSDVPVGSDQAPAGFEVLTPLSVYVGQHPMHFY